jgi:pilus assembly protein CpaD
VIRGLFRKDAMMRSKLLLIALCSTVGACTIPTTASQGVSSVNVPVVTAADYVFDASAPDGALAPGETERLDGWFQGLSVGYGDLIYVDGADAYQARNQVAAIAGHYGMTVLAGAPVTAGAVQPGTVRVIVSRRRAVVPGCPNWSETAQSNFNNKSMTNFGCGVNSDIAAMVANPEDLIHGREGAGVVDANTSTKAVIFYRNSPPTGEKGLQSITTKGSQ